MQATSEYETSYGCGLMLLRRGALKMERIGIIQIQESIRNNNLSRCCCNIPARYILVEDQCFKVLRQPEEICNLISGHDDDDDDASRE